MKRVCFITMMLFFVTLWGACESRPPQDEPWDLAALIIEMDDAYEVPSGLYTIEYTIENLQDYVREFGVEVSVEVYDENQEAIALDGTTFTAEPGAVYTVIVTVYQEETQVVTSRTITVTVAELPIETVTVTFDPANGLEVFTVDVDLGAAVDLPEEPTYEGHTFIGWSTSDERDKLWDFSTPIEVDITLVALWQADSTTVYFLSYNLNDGTQDVFIYEGNQTGFLVLPTDEPERDGYHFTGWAYDPTGKRMAQAGDVVEQTLSFYAQWEAIEYVLVTFEKNDGSGASFAVTVERGQLVSEEAAPERIGWIFEGWSTLPDADQFWAFATEPVDDNLTLYARWTRDMSGTLFTVTFEVLADDVLPVDAQQVPEGAFAEYPLPHPFRLDYHFIGWFIDPDSTEMFQFDDTPITADITLYAGWHAMYGTVYAVNYWLNDGTDTLFTSDNVSEGFLFLIGMVPSRDGYAFTGWFLDQAGTVPADSNVYVDADLDVYAGWSEIVGTVLPAPTNLQFEAGVLSFDPYELVDGQLVVTGFFIYVNGAHAATAFTNSHDLSHLIGEAGSYEIQVLAKGLIPYYLDSPLSEVLEVVIEVEDDTDQGYFIYEDDFGYLRIIGLTEAGEAHVKETKELIIPNSIDGVPVYAIDAYAFFSLSYDLGEDLGLDPEDWSEENNWNRDLLILDKVVIPSNVNYIFDNAFTGNQIKRLTIGSQVERIEYGAFQGVGQLEHVKIPGSVSYIGVMAFSEMPDLKSVEMLEGVLTIDNSAFQYNMKLESVTFAASTTYIGYGAFLMTPALGVIQLPTGLETLGASAFQHSGMTSVTVPKGLASIGQYAFSGLGLTDITVHPDNSLYMDVEGVLFNKEMTRLIQYPLGRTTKTYLIPEGVEVIGAFAFDQAVYLEEVSVPSTVTSVETFAFFDIQTLKVIEFKGAVPPMLGSRAFMHEVGIGVYEPLPNMVIVVPSNYVDTYKSASGFSFYEDVIAGN